MLNHVWLILLFPALGSAMNMLYGKKLSKKTSGRIACAVIGISFFLSILVFLSLIKLPPEERFAEDCLFTWISAGDFVAFASLQVDQLSAIMILIITGVGFLIHIYSVGYMRDDEGFSRYFSYLNLFSLSMLILVLSDNFLLMLVGWKGVGLCSYLLIGFWYEKKSAGDAGKKAFIVNRVGDFGFILAMLLIFVTFGTLNFTEVFHSAPDALQSGGSVVTMITLLLFVGAVGKSAQLPLYTWLPDAMEGPTPVSALIHAATMVTAGVYMVSRCSVLYEMAPLSMTVVAVIGAGTALFAAIIGLVQNDIKRVLAYSTISQLGYMFLACGVGAYVAAIFHLMTHAFFKALLFLGSGSVIHALGGEQDMRKMGGLRSRLKKTHLTFFIGTLAIAGIPPFAGFFSKDEILFEALINGNKLYWVIGAVAAFLTSFYMFRLLFMTFYGKSRMDKHVEEHVHESPSNMILPLMVLALLALVGGFVGLPGLSLISKFLGPVMASEHGHELGKAIAEGMHGGGHMTKVYIMMAVSTGIAIAGILLAYIMYMKVPSLPGRLAARFSLLHKVILNKFYVDEIYDAIFVNPTKKFSIFLWKFFDVKVVDGIVNGTATIVELNGSMLKMFQTGFVRNYAFLMVFGGILIILFTIFF
ncbi:MAG: NADH-quinone oxidoreductase subunit L [Candidatus Anammoxibacter sp.]